MPEDFDSTSISRRSILVGAAIVPITAIRSAAQVTGTSPAGALTPDQLKLLDAFAERLVPKDENGPGASELGAANYIDRALADAISAEKGSFVAGLAATDAFAVKSQGKSFVDLSPEAKDAVITALENGSATGFDPNSRGFFTRARRLVLEGCFSDPYYGGNKGFGGWDLIGYPGPRLAVAPEEQVLKETIKPVRMSVWGGANGH
jgi:hypothetical protein